MGATLVRACAALLLAGSLGAASAARADTSLASGVGLAWLTTSGGGANDASVGLVLEALGAHRFGDGPSVRLRLGWGLTHFQRTAEAIEFGNQMGAATADGYAAVTEWLVDGDARWGPFKLLGSIVAYTFLAGGFAIAGSAYALSPLFATSFLEMGLTGAAHLAPPGAPTDLFVEGGLGTLLYVHPVRSQLVGGAGPLVGAGLRHGRLRVGLHLLWSPPLFQSDSPREGTHALAGGLSFGVSTGGAR